ncbi:amino acid permease-3 [Coleophoma crateriformis]|uniref:Amino acid permease-3 n=1 Tax=Coleophoma crateriformis TaxID=565419 RepID=A0A3D8S3W5_9HELO|nr:amino acid permease-3 [Coleophoma crateriformis]
MSSWEVMAMNMGATFYNGGPQTLAWGIIAVVIGALAQASSMAELAAIQPIAGAQYHWTHLLAPENHKRFITWMQGWVTWFAWVSALAGSTSSEANILLGLISVNYTDYVYHSWHLTLLIIAQLVVAGLINMYAFRTIPWIELFAGVMHVLLFIIFVVVLSVKTPAVSSSNFVFFEKSVFSGWENSFVTWNIGLLVPAWGFIGFDGVVHMSEEVRKAKQAVPRAMIWTILINGVMAYGIILCLLFTMGNASVLHSSFPIIPICINATGLKAGTAMVCGLLVITFCVVTASLASVSRITWAWARDGALPHYFAKIHPYHRVPIRSLWLPIIIVGILSVLNVGSNSATVFSAFTALSSLGLYSSYIIAISCMLHARLTGRIGDGPQYSIRYGEWQLPRGWGTPINVFALLWTMYLTVWLPFPTTIPVTGRNMNYAGPIYVFVVVAAVMYWYSHGRKRWPGLNATAIAMVEAER